MHRKDYISILKTYFWKFKIMERKQIQKK